MAENFYTILTAVGKSKLANSVALGNKVNLKTLKVGDGNGTYYEPSENQTSLVNKVWEGNISSISIDESNSNWIVIQTIIPATDGGFFIREAGIFDEAGDLIAVSKISETYKPVISEGSTKDVSIKIVLEVSNVDNITLKIDPNVIVATKNDIEVLESEMQDISVQLSGKANDAEISRTTTAKDVTGAINELNTNKAPLANPSFTGTPTAPTAALGTNSVQVATTAFINNLLASIGSNLVFSNSGTVTRGIVGTVGGNDAWRMVGGATATDFGFLEIATGDNGTEPIYVRQYSGGDTTGFSSIARTLTLLDGSGNTSIPGVLTSNVTNGIAPFAITSQTKVNNLNADMLDGFHMNNATVTGTNWGCIPYVGGDGVMEVGKFIDFHITSSSTSDQDVRLTAGSGVLYIQDKIIATILSGGTQMQSGSVAVASQSFGGGSLYSFTVTFPVAFSSIPRVTCSCTYGNSVYGPCISVENISTTGFTLKIGYTSAVTTAPTFNWIAIG